MTEQEKEDTIEAIVSRFSEGKEALIRRMLTECTDERGEIIAGGRRITLGELIQRIDREVHVRVPGMKLSYHVLESVLRGQSPPAHPLMTRNMSSLVGGGRICATGTPGSRGGAL